LVLSCEHASNRLPFAARPSPAERRLLASHWGWDIGAWELTRELARRLRTSAVGGRWSRLVIDLNRRLDDPTLIRRKVEQVALSWNRQLDIAEIERRFLDYHAPYHLQLDRLILQRLVRDVRPLILAVHSFTGIYHGRLRPFDVGVLYDKHPALAHRLGRALRTAGLSVRYNQPYSGMAGLMYAADRHGTHYGLPCLELELNQRLFRRKRAASRLGRIVAEALRELVAR
jgi:predicted N-formylglutamate amidohydrolase